MSDPFHYGGQAVIEGVMMRGRRGMAVAVRHPSGEIVAHAEPLDRGFYASPWVKRPFVRGALLLWDTLALGMRALLFSAAVAAGDEAAHHEATQQAPSAAGSGATPGAAAQSRAAAQEAFGGGVLWGTMVAALAVAVGVFFVSPLLLTRLVDRFLPTALLSVVFEGAVRAGLFAGYVWLIGRVPDVRRVFAYHGAEHKTINAYEAGEPLRPERVARYGVAHPRCGTSFLLYVVALSIVVFAFLGRPPLLIRLASRVLLVPVVAALAYELIRFSGRHYRQPVVRLLLAPGMALQALTTAEPDTAQVEVAIAALERVFELDATLAPAASAESRAAVAAAPQA